MTTVPTESTIRQQNAKPYIAAWLLIVAALIFAMVLVGGATRLTGSGLSITEWKPILGAIPPLSTADWQDAFEKYKEIPQYKEINLGMSLDEFKAIYWWEWAHRFLGRFIGLVFLLPFLFFLARRWVEPALKPKLWALFALGGLQGFVGWYMVASGLVERTEVSQYRLAMHLGLAIFIFAAILWVTFGLRKQDEKQPPNPPVFIVWSAGALVGLIYLQIIAGAFVAGLRAGKTYNTWPLIDGQFIPTDLLLLQPVWLNFFENVRTVQFDHRMLAYLVTVAVLLHLYNVWRKAGMGGLPKAAVNSALYLAIATLAQVALGVVTLLKVVPLEWALGHQAGALILLGLALWHLFQLRGAGGAPAA